MPDLYVNVYEVGRFCAGPEEGGDWRDCGTPVAAIPVEMTDEDFDQMRLDAIDKKVLAYNSSDGSYNPVLERKHHVHDDWCEPRDTDTYDGQTIPEFSGRCYEKDWRQFRHDWIVQNLASPIAEEWREKYPPTGKRSSVLGGEDYDVVIEKHWPEPFPKTVEPYS